MKPKAMTSQVQVKSFKACLAQRTALAAKQAHDKASLN